MTNSNSSLLLTVCRLFVDVLINSAASRGDMGKNQLKIFEHHCLFFSSVTNKNRSCRMLQKGQEIYFIIFKN